MAIDALTNDDLVNQEPTTQEADERLAAGRVRTLHNKSKWFDFLLPLASLWVTCVLFAMAIFLIYAGTLAQVDQDIWDVMNQYFRTTFAWIPFQVFFPPAFFPGEPWQVPGGFYFPGGFLIGAAMGINLLAAHALRFRVQAKGPRLLAGLAVIAVGVAMVWLVVQGGTGKDTIEGAAPMAWSTLWAAVKWSLVALWVAGAYALVKLEREQTLERVLLVIGEAILGALLVFLFTRSETAALGDSSMRILWQLIKGGLAGVVLLAGCWLVFRKRAGIVLLHGGIMLVMANELVVYGLHKEGQMTIAEGETVNYSQDIRAVELAVSTPQDEKHDDVVVVAQKLLEEDALIHDDALPFDVQVVKYLKNSELKNVKPGEKNLATEGVGLKTEALPRRAGAGTDTESKVDFAAAYVKLFKKGTKDELGTWLVGIALPPQKVTVADKSYDLELRFERDYKTYSIQLVEFHHDKYLGTQTPKNFASDVRVIDPTRGVDREVKIWMNNPLRFAGETLYQSSFFPPETGRKGTVLTVVNNAGWMIPYVACMLVGTGMLAQFSITLLRFLRRQHQVEGPSQLSARARNAQAPGRRMMDWAFPLGVVTVAAICVFAAARPRAIPTDQMKLDEFGTLPVVHDGRVKPLDSVARNTVRYLSWGKQFYTDDQGQKQPAVKWLLDTIAGDQAAARKSKVLRIDNLELLDTLDLERTKGFRYSIDDIDERLAELDKQVQLAANLEARDLSPYQKKLMDLAKKLRAIRQVELAFEPPPLRPDHAQEDLPRALQQLEALKQMPLPLAVPPGGEQKDWDNFASAWFNGVKDRAQGKEPNPAMVMMTEMIVDYGKGDVKGFNSTLARYQNWLEEHPPADYSPQKVRFEAFFNAIEPFYWALGLYVIAFILGVLSWLGWTVPLGRASFWLIVLALALHTFALIARIYISGRPPVTNLYSSAVFIGWAGVVFGLAFELIYKLGVGSVIASVAGFTTLLIANFLAGLSDGDTLGVLQAVLDTQFWLATHVVCETLGYSTTFIAGLLGVIYILLGVLTKKLSPAMSKDLGRMIYGTLCFALFFSFIGTVLGGLWADDSWGRFWGWDPKENGALMIVLWDALVLHARWGGIVKDRGMAVLALGGNIITGWSWFGVNELGKGLHSYGFTEGVLLALGIFILTQLALMGMAMIPRRYWLSSQA